MERSVQAEDISKHAVLASNILFLESYQTGDCKYLYAHMQNLLLLNKILEMHIVNYVSKKG